MANNINKTGQIKLAYNRHWYIKTSLDMYNHNLTELSFEYLYSQISY